MTSSKSRIIPAIVVAALGVTVGTVQAAEPANVDSMQKQIEALQAQVNELKTTQSQQLSKADVDATVDRVLSDADRRSQMLDADGFTAGWQKGKFLLQSADGNFKMNPSLMFQFRNATTYNESGKASGDDYLSNGFEVRRFKIGFAGNAFSPDLTYKFLLVLDRNSAGNNTGATMEDEWVNYKFADAMSVTLGQFKGPVTREGLYGILANERSYQSDIMMNADNYMQGVSLLYGGSADALHAQVAFGDGAGKKNSNALDPGQGGVDADYNLAGRVEYKVFGDWKNNSSASSLGVEKDLLVLGAGADFTQTGDTDVSIHSVDALYKLHNGLALMGVYDGKFTSAASGDTYDWGVVLQAGYMLNDKWEVFGRYAYLDLETVGAGYNNQINEFAVGANYYFKGDNAKFTVDLVYLPNGAPTADSGADIQAAQDTEIVLRGQFQLAI